MRSSLDPFGSQFNGETHIAAIMAPIYTAPSVFPRAGDAMVNAERECRNRSRTWSDPYSVLFSVRSFRLIPVSIYEREENEKSTLYGRFYACWEWNNHVQAGKQSCRSHRIFQSVIGVGGMLNGDTGA